LVIFYTHNEDQLPARIKPPDLAHVFIESLDGTNHARYLTSDITWGHFERYLATNEIMEKRANWEDIRAAQREGI